MRTSSAVMLGVMLIAGHFGLTRPAEAAEDSRRQYAIEIDCRDAKGHPEALRCAATIRSLEGGEVLAAPSLVFLPEEAVNTESKVPGSGERVRLEAKLEGATLNYEVIITAADDTLLGQHRGVVKVAL